LAADPTSVDNKKVKLIHASTGSQYLRNRRIGVGVGSRRSLVRVEVEFVCFQRFLDKLKLEPTWSPSTDGLQCLVSVICRPELLRRRPRLSLPTTPKNRSGLPKGLPTRFYFSPFVTGSNRAYRWRQAGCRIPYTRPMPCAASTSGY
jgi:hypothetical protein